MGIEIYNTMTRQKEIFKPIEEGKVQFYVCGPTVYNYIHIGNARSAVAFDTIRRYLEYRGYEVNYVSNFTDVDDKIIKAAKQEGLSPKELADKYIAAYKEDTQKINIKTANVHPRVMENIPEIIDFIQDLVDQGFAYEADGDVYFRTQKFDDYGKLSNKSVSELLVGASQRVDAGETERKEAPIDFALWKANRQPDEISWPSPWGPGRPGWHIECSVMSTKYLGEQLDIHGGGQDLEFPHHENEIAQSEAHSGHTFANYWMHNGFVTVGAQDEKMSKSLGNFVLLRDMLNEVDPLVVRYLLASVHYRRPLRYDDTTVQEAQVNIDRLKELHRRLSLRLKDENLADALSTDQEWQNKIRQHEADFVQAMDDDFNAANGLTVIFEMVKEMNRYLSLTQCSRTSLQMMLDRLETLLSIFGLIFENEEEILDAEIIALIEERKQARLNKDYQRADEIRKHLKEQGVELDDTPQGTVWKRQ
ncbi:cysteine--tRNA ligase [Ignavigranum ruoffiae]|uniref:cysteine--tRNA ligase n=1 Tax=Ignavigranum ruoffiae TaxID=89093 RepID=UPI0024AE0EF7|nr:cysteine--tRNA ligase [Ignavigranum ruoffiae]